MTIRQATDKDIPLLTNIIRTSNQDIAERFQLTPQNAPKHPSNCTDAWIESAFEKGITYYVLEDENILCGCIALEQVNAEVCYIERLAVLPSFRRKGFGEALVKHAFAEARKRHTCRVEIGTIAEHTQLTKWYQKLGFTVKNTVKFDHLPFNVTFMFIEFSSSE